MAIIKKPRRQFCTPGQLAEYWRGEFNVKVSEFDVKHYIEAGLIKTSVRYEHNDGAWWDDEQPELIHKWNMADDYADAVWDTSKRAPDYSSLKKHHYIRLAEAERFELEHFTDTVSCNDASAIGQETTLDQLRFVSLQPDNAVDEIEILILLPTPDPVEEEQQTPELLAAKLISEGVDKRIIAHELNNKFGLKSKNNPSGIDNWGEVAKLADTKKTYHASQEKAGNPRKTGERWGKEGKILKEMSRHKI